MKAARYHTFGNPQVLKIEEVTQPKPTSKEVLVEVLATTVNSGDCHLRSGEPFIARLFAGPFTPKNKILGTTFSGRISEVGSDVKRFKKGDLVYGSFGVNSGTHAEYLTISEDETISHKPEFLSHEEAAALVFGPISAIYFLKKAGIEKNKKVLIIGGAGGVGSYAIQVAKHYGAHVTAVCGTNDIDFVKSLGADKIIDYRKQTAIDYCTSNALSFDIILDMVCNATVNQIKSILNQQGSYTGTLAKLPLLIEAAKPTQNKKFTFDVSKSDAKVMDFISELAQLGHFKPLISAVYSLKDISKAHSHVEDMPKRGAVVVSME